MKLLRVKASHFKNCCDGFTIDITSKSKKTAEDKEYELQEIAPDLHAFNTAAFIGKNASGKTSAIELLDCAYSILGEFRLEGKHYSYDGVQLDSVILEATILPTRTYDVASLIGTINSVEEGYVLKAVHISPENLTVAARSEVLDQMKELALSEHFVDLAGLSETTTYQIKVSKPSEDAVLSNDIITVTVDVVPVEPDEAETTAEEG